MPTRTDMISLQLPARAVTGILHALAQAKKATRNPRNPDHPSGSDMSPDDWQEITDEIRRQLAPERESAIDLARRIRAKQDG